jgi:anion-transporting  ArsA/GET3 family ATPase
MELLSERHPLLVVVGAGGVGKTTLAAGLGLVSARAGQDTLVMTFDPAMRLKDTLGVGDQARDAEVPVPTDAPGRLDASLLDAGRTFDRLVERYAPDDEARRRILENRFYRHLAGRLSGILEYMAVERLCEVADEGRYDRVVLDTPPTRQALDFLEAPQRIVSFLDSGALRIALKPWFDPSGRLRPASRLRFLGKGVEAWLDRVVGLGLLRDMAEFFQAFEPLYDGFRERALKVQQLLRSPQTLFVLVAGPGEEQIPDAMFFARALDESRHNVGPIIVNRVHPRMSPSPPDRLGEDSSAGQALRLMHWLGERDHRGLEQLRSLLPDQPLIRLPLMKREPIDLPSLERLGQRCLEGFSRSSATTSTDPQD